jgi:hypothetical protein
VSLRRYCLLFAAALIPAAFSQQLPPVYFNHFFMFMDPDTLNDLMASPFLNKEFSAFDKTTMHQDGGKLSYTGIYLDGRATYLEFLPQRRVRHTHTQQDRSPWELSASVCGSMNEANFH